MHRWMGEMFYRGIDPTGKGYTELRYFGQWHKAINDADMNAMRG